MIHSSLFLRGALALVVALTLVAAPAQAADQTKFLPNETAVYFTVNFKQILQSKLIPKEAIAQIKDALSKQEGVEKYLKLLGLDPFTDFDSLTMTLTSATEQEKFMVIVTGKFDVDKFQGLAEKIAKENEEVLKIKKEGDYKVWEISIPNQPITLHAVMVDKTTILITGDKDLLKEGLAKAAGKNKTELKKEVAAFLKKAKKSSMTFMIQGSLLAKAPIPGADNEIAKGILEKLEVISGAINITDEIKIHIGVTTSDAGTAALINLLLREGLKKVPQGIDALAEQFEKLAPYKDLLKDFVKSVKVVAKENQVDANATITKEMLDKLVKELKKAKDD